MDLSLFDDVLLDGLDFCSKTYTLFEEVKNSANGTTRLRMRPTSLEKKLLEELLPISAYVQASYRPGRYMSVRWKSGSQSYDAELIQHGAYVSQDFYPAISHLEVTCTMHQKEYLKREHLETKGGVFGLDGITRLKSGQIQSLPVVYSNHEFINSYAEIVRQRIAKKSAMSYPEDTTLVVQCTLNRLYCPDEWETLMTLVAENLPRSPFREIFLYDMVCHYKKTLYPPR